MNSDPNISVFLYAHTQIFTKYGQYYKLILIPFKSTQYTIYHIMYYEYWNEWMNECQHNIH